MEAKVILYLEALGVQITTGDALLGMVIREVEQRLKNLSNQAELLKGWSLWQSEWWWVNTCPP